MRMRRTGILMAVVTAVVGMVVLPAGASADPYCGITWGSGAKSASPTTVSELVNVRAGRHDCYDRLVFDTNGSVDGYWVSYAGTVYEDPTGAPVPLRGGARLSVTAQAPSYDETYTPTYTPANRAELVNVAGFQTFRQVAWAGSFEGTTTVGLGVRARLPFRVFTLPGRVVVDVAHFW
jgi:hypothetical protein